MDEHSVSAVINRMQFLRGDFAGKAKPLRPPWAISEAAFSQLCTRCGECISQCPNHLIRSGRGDFPVIDFNAGECLFCEACVDTCKPGALKKTPDKPVWTVRATLDSTVCLACRNIECLSCYDPCEARAVSLTARIGGVAIPMINSAACTGCGACFGVCPVHAIKMISKPLQVTR